MKYKIIYLRKIYDVIKVSQHFKDNVKHNFNLWTILVTFSSPFTIFFIYYTLNAIFFA